MFTYYTNINKANKAAKTLKATIPKEITDLLKVNACDKLQWDVDVVDNETFNIIVRKAPELP